MSSENIGIEEARKRLGDLVTAAQQGADIIITRNGKPAARLTRHEETAMTAIAYVDVETGSIDVQLPADVQVGADVEAHVSPWGGGEDEMNRADAELANMGWQRVGDWFDPRARTGRACRVEMSAASKD